MKYTHGRRKRTTSTDIFNQFAEEQEKLGPEGPPRPQSPRIGDGSGIGGLELYSP